MHVWPSAIGQWPLGHARALCHESMLRTPPRIHVALCVLATVDDRIRMSALFSSLCLLGRKFLVEFLAFKDVMVGIISQKIISIVEASILFGCSQVFPHFLPRSSFENVFTSCLFESFSSKLPKMSYFRASIMSDVEDEGVSTISLKVKTTTAAYDVEVKENATVSDVSLLTLLSSCLICRLTSSPILLTRALLRSRMVYFDFFFYILEL